MADSLPLAEAEGFLAGGDGAGFYHPTGAAQMFGYRNITDNGVTRGCFTTREAAETHCANLMAQYPGKVFAPVPVRIVTTTERRWQTGNGRAGGDVLVSHTVKYLREA